MKSCMVLLTWLAMAVPGAAAVTGAEAVTGAPAVTGQSFNDAASQRKAALYASEARHYAAAGKPATAFMARHYRELSQRYALRATSVRTGS